MDGGPHQITDRDRRERYLSLKLHGLREAPEVVAVVSDDEPEAGHDLGRSEEHTSELQSLMRISYAVFCLKKQKLITTAKYNKLSLSIIISSEKYKSQTT